MKEARFMQELKQCWQSNNLLRVIRAHCVECMGMSRQEVEGCTSELCALYPWRSGTGRREGFKKARSKLAQLGLSPATVKASKRTSPQEPFSDPKRQLEPTKAPAPIPEHRSGVSTAENEVKDAVLHGDRCDGDNHDAGCSLAQGQKAIATSHQPSPAMSRRLL